MVMEYVPNSDLHSILKSKSTLSMKWRLKVAIDCAAGMRCVVHLLKPGGDGKKAREGWRELWRECEEGRDYVL